jgi:hypothetical protein
VLEFFKTHRGTGVQAARVFRKLARGAVSARARARAGSSPIPGAHPASPDREGEDGPMLRGAWLYATAAGAVAVAVGVCAVPWAPWGQVNLPLFFALAALQGVILVTSAFPEFGESPAVPASIALQLAAVILLGPGPAAAAAGLAALSLTLKPSMSVRRVATAFTAVVFTLAVGGGAYCALHGARTPTRVLPLALCPAMATSVALSVVAAILVGATSVVGGGAHPRAAARSAVLHGIPRNAAFSCAGLLAAVLWLDRAQVIATLVVLGPWTTTRWAGQQYAAQRAAHDATVRTLVQAVEIKDWYTRGHSERVATVSEMIARRLDLDARRVEILRHAAILHDLGKVGVPTRLLRKDGRLDADEMAAIRLHPARGLEVVKDIEFLGEAYTAILYHHERVDGRGYPSGLAGDAIPEFARIIAVADAFDSMTSTRSYRPARPVATALVELRNAAGSQFDPRMVEAIEQALAEVEREGRPWCGDGTISIDVGAESTARAVSGHASVALDAGSREHPPASQGGLPAPRPARMADLYGRAETGSGEYEGAGQDRTGYTGDDYDHDDPAFASPTTSPTTSPRPITGGGFPRQNGFGRWGRR